MRSYLQATALAVLPFAAVPAGAQAQVPAAPTILADGTLLDVQAEGSTTRAPDVATIRAGVVTQSATAAAALGDNAQRMARVLDALKRAGVNARDVQTATVNLSPQYRYAEGQAPTITGYQATNSVAIRFRDIAKAGAILDTLAGVGANQIDGPNLSIDNPEAALDEARAAAIKIARARADLYARAAGLSVARIVSIAETGVNDGATPGPVMFQRAVRADSTPVAAGESRVSASLTVRFLLK
ncbi:SIMPL domain-containing protein [Sphingomonas sp. H39-1-10]|uniref:SIMPL domain-containing protein n=1 Tax=Sphingomonas pollutisoli TaxID=3030829 RepID=UPI0023B8CCA7|nr:SIMPL domain-containing protein [Sphingomonas pollutisoli]MDF0488267.1 SIMPL domain-containing protein [Sphingomonas pollutisoli]